MEAEERIRRAALEAARKRAEKILKEAKENAESIIKRAEEERKRRIEEEGSRILAEAKMRARERIAEAKLEAKKILTTAKLEIVDEIRKRVLEALRGLPEGKRRKSLEKIIEEGVSYLPSGKIRILVSPKDREAAEEIANHLELDAEIVSSEDVLGGAVLETPDGETRVLNTYDVRLEEVLEREMPRIISRLSGE